MERWCYHVTADEEPLGLLFHGARRGAIDWTEKSTREKTASRIGLHEVGDDGRRAYGELMTKDHDIGAVVEG
jgi:hypothetical protein